MPGGNFHDRLTLRPDGGVDSAGPLDADAEILEICAWVTQRLPGRNDDAAATEMTTDPHGRADFSQDPLTQPPPREWRLRLRRIDRSSALELGPATAMAMALIKFGKGQVKGLLWTQSVELVAPDAG